MVVQEETNGMPRMIHDTGEILHKLTARLWDRPFQDYLSSDDFTRFCRDNGLSDEWRKYLELCRDNPALLGDSSVQKHAFFLFLAHVYHHMPERFLFLLTRLLLDFSRGISCDLPVEEIRSSLLDLGYPQENVDAAVSLLIKREVSQPGM